MSGEEEVRVAALKAAIAWFRDCCGEDEWLPRQVVIDTAMRFEEYIKSGE